MGPEGRAVLRSGRTHYRGGRADDGCGKAFCIIGDECGGGCLAHGCSPLRRKKTIEIKSRRAKEIAAMRCAEEENGGDKEHKDLFFQHFRCKTPLFLL